MEIQSDAITTKLLYSSGSGPLLPKPTLLQEGKLLSTIEIKGPENCSTPSCGIGWYRPRWMQKLASKKTFVVIYALIGMINFAVGAYSGGILTTLEKHFKMSSQVSGLISSATDIGTICASIVITYIAGKGHRTKWLAFGTFLMGIASFVRVLPYVIYGPGDAKLYTVEYYGSQNRIINENVVSGDVKNANFSPINIIRTSENCRFSTKPAETMPATIFFIANMLFGIGACVYWTCGASYLDDNVRKNVVPLLLAIVQTIRLCGPTVGMLMASYTLQIFIDPYLSPTIDSKDPRWIGAWWIGWYIIGTLTIILAAFMALFPKVLPRTALRNKNAVNKKQERSYADFKESLNRILKNKIVMYNSFSTVCFVMGLTAYWQFMPKYMETQFQMTASESNFILGTIGTLLNGLGVMSAGIFITKFKPSPRFLTGWTVFIEVLDVIGHGSYVMFSCPEKKLHGRWNENSSWNLTMECNSKFSCGLDIQYSPVCDLANEMVYYSPCHAGCSYTVINDVAKFYDNCSCVQDYGTVKEGICPTDCSYNVILFMSIMAVLSFTSATGRSANSLIQFRSVSDEDKSLSIGISEFLLSILAFVPSPIVYGIIVDWMCLIWGDDCGSLGNCWLYDGFKLRYIFNLSATAFILFGTILDAFVWYYSKGLKIYEEDYTTENGSNFYNM